MQQVMNLAPLLGALSAIRACTSTTDSLGRVIAIGFVHGVQELVDIAFLI